MYIFNCVVVSWHTKKQTCVALSIMGAEFVIGSMVGRDDVWLRRFFEHIGLLSKTRTPINIYYDNQATNASTKNIKFHSPSTSTPDASSGKMCIRKENYH